MSDGAFCHYCQLRPCRCEFVKAWATSERMTPGGPLKEPMTIHAKLRSSEPVLELERRLKAAYVPPEGMGVVPWLLVLEAIVLAVKFCILMSSYPSEMRAACRERGTQRRRRMKRRIVVRLVDLGVDRPDNYEIAEAALVVCSQAKIAEVKKLWKAVKDGEEET